MAWPLLIQLSPDLTGSDDQGKSAGPNNPPDGLDWETGEKRSPLPNTDYQKSSLLLSPSRRDPIPRTLPRATRRNSGGLVVSRG